MKRSERTPHTCVFGLGWGDEGKGKLVDLLCPDFDYVIRFNGGANAGHTVVVGSEKFALHLLPTGVLHEKAIGVIGPGVVVDSISLIGEIDALAQRGIDVLPRLRISDRAHLVLAYHKIEDQLSEQAAGDGGKIGTTSRGIGPCYADKMRRTTAVRFCDLLDEKNLRARVVAIVAKKRAGLEAMFSEPRQHGAAAQSIAARFTRGSETASESLTADAILTDLETARSRLRSCICDTTALLHDAIDAGKSLLFEGANGMLLDVDHGTYPYVTSSSTGPHGIGPGAGVPPSAVTRLIGVTKAYSTRVGGGPFVSELKDAVGDRIRERGHEFGTTTGRPRRCGWFDAVACRYAARISGATDVALMHLDTLGTFEQVGICTAYRVDGETLTTPPASAARLERAEPVIEFLPGWGEDIRSAHSFDELPLNARRYVERIQSLLGTPATMLGTGPERTQVVMRNP
ncbi:MAG: adenylosuccinate synthase [Planctomycetes bacterium]|nr:adenylosuccinate synthase [Planctomycetota bacterium]MBI3835462.1 adenylosuccinate synthase [Planctomycetota bacterium]